MSLLIEATTEWQTQNRGLLAMTASRSFVFSSPFHPRLPVPQLLIASPFAERTRLFSLKADREYRRAGELLVGELLIKSHKVYGVIAITVSFAIGSSGSESIVAATSSLHRLNCWGRGRSQSITVSRSIPMRFFFCFSKNFQPTASSSGLMPLVPGPGTEFASFGDRDLLLGLTSEEAWVNLSDEDVQVSSYNCDT